MKRIMLFAFLVLCSGVGLNFSMAQETTEAEQTVIKGSVKEIAKDGSYIMIDATRIKTTKEFIDDAYLEVDDKVEITAEKKDSELIAVDYTYIFDDEDEIQDEQPQAGSEIEKE